MTECVCEGGGGVGRGGRSRHPRGSPLLDRPTRALEARMFGRVHSSRALGPRGDAVSRGRACTRAPPPGGQFHGAQPPRAPGLTPRNPPTPRVQAAVMASDAAGSVPPPVEDRRTEAEKRAEAHAARHEEARIRKMAAKSHRERVAELNEKLATLTEASVGVGCQPGLRRTFFPVVVRGGPWAPRAAPQRCVG